jgi:peptidylprolyl isomerase
MIKAKSGDTVKVHYKGYLVDGSLFDSSIDKEPFEFTIGQKMVLPGFENTVIGMKEGDTQTLTLAAEDAYGHRREDLVVTIPKSRIPRHTNPQLGSVMQVHLKEEEVMNVTIIDITDDTIILDGNHPLAGRNLTFNIELLEVIPRTMEEHSIPHGGTE